MDDGNPYRAPSAANNLTGSEDAAFDFATVLERRRVPREEIAARLARRGFTPAVIGAAISRLPAKPQRAGASGTTRGWLGGRGPFVLLALGVTAAGAFVAWGNLTGVAPTMPYLGSALMLFGAILLRISQS